MKTSRKWLKSIERQEVSGRVAPHSLVCSFWLVATPPPRHSFYYHTTLYCMLVPQTEIFLRLFERGIYFTIVTAPNKHICGS